MARHYVSNRTPSTPAELAQALSDPATAAELFGGSPQQWAAFEEEYAAASPVLARMAEERAQVQFSDALRSMEQQRAPRGVSGAAGGGRSRLYNEKAPGVLVEGILPESEWPLAQYAVTLNPRNDGGQPKRTELKNAMGERVPSQGGFLLPETLRSGLMELVLERSAIRQRAAVVPMDSLRVPVPSIDDTSHESSVYGGVAAFWTAEGAALTATAPKFSRVVLEAAKLTAFTQIPNELLQDAGPVLELWLRESWPAAISWYEEDAFINGDGVNQPQGFLSASCAVTVPTATAHVITLADVISAYTRMLPAALPDAVWLCSPDAKGQLLSLSPVVDSTAIAPPAWLAGMQAIDGEPSTLLGKPVIVTEKMPSAASSNTTVPGALALCNFSYYLIGDRSEIQTMVSEEYAFANDMTSYRLIERLDGRAWPQAPLTPRNGGPTLSPFVLLDTTGA